jgi:hypothetical protein
MNSGGWGYNPNKYLFRNGKGWWMRVQPYDPTKTERLAFNMKTRDIEEARRKRDEMIASNGWRFAR